MYGVAQPIASVRSRGIIEHFMTMTFFQWFPWINGWSRLLANSVGDLHHHQRTLSWLLVVCYPFV